MLPLFSQFSLNYAVRNPAQIAAPKINNTPEIIYPRGSIIHHLDIDSEVKFVNRTEYFFNNIPPNKKVPVSNLTDLLVKDNVRSIKDKYLQRDIRNWDRANIKAFRELNLLETQTTDDNVVSVINYNTLKQLYNYNTGLLADHYYYTNLYKTVFSNIELIANSSNKFKHFITMKLPNVIPSYLIIDRLITLNDIKYNKVIKDKNLRLIIEIYKWLSDKNRDRSVLSNIKDETSLDVILNIEYKGKVVFIPLHLFRSLLKESKLESKIKVDDVSKIHKLFIVTLLRLQNTINTELSKTEVEELPEYDSVSPDNEDGDTSTDSDTPSDDIEMSNLTKTKNFNKDKLKEIDDNIIKNSIEVTSVDSLLDLDDSAETENGETDKLYIDTITKADLESEDEIEEEETHTKTIDTETLRKSIRDTKRSEKLEEFILESKEVKALTSAEIRSLKKLNEDREVMKSPYDRTKQLDSYTLLTDEDKVITEEERILNIPHIKNKHLKTNTVVHLHKRYVKNVMKKDIVACVTKLEDSGIIIKKYEIETHESAMGKYETHTLSIKPFKGKESTVYFRLPVIDDDGRFMASGIKYIMRKQRADVPIRKISPTKVGITSNYCKLFISRTERKAFSPDSYIVDYVKEQFLEQTGLVAAIELGNNYSNKHNVPTMFSVMSSTFTFIELNDYMLQFDLKNITQRVNEKVINDLTSKNLTYIGYHIKTKQIIVMDNNNDIHLYTPELKQIGKLEDILSIDTSKVPTSFSTVKILGDDIPLGVVLAFYIGLDKLIALTDADVKYMESGKQYKPTSSEFVIKFKDYKLIVNKNNKEASLLLAGFLFFKNYIKNYKLSDFNDKNIYLLLLDERDFNITHLKELDLLRDLFLDPVTVDELKIIKEPTEFIPLLMRANEMLTTYSHPDIGDTNYVRFRGYDRVPGLMYKALTESVRNYKFKFNSKSKIELDPYKVWNYVTQDNTVKITEDINPMMDLKEIESVTLTGSDGLSREAISESLREYHKNDMGVISEATVDSSDVAVNTYLVPGAELTDVRGNVKKDKVVDNKNQLISTSALLTPFILHDDPKRINFVNVQNSHTITAVGYRQPSIRTEYEYTIPYEVSGLYCYIAEDDGVVVNRTDTNLSVKFKNGTEKAFEIGKVFGRAEGTVYKHHIACELEKNDKFKKGQWLYFNSNFFEKDWLDPSVILLKYNKVITVALSMTNNVYEDSSAITKEVSNDMTTTVVKDKSFVLDFKKNIINMVGEGGKVEPHDYLFTILDEYADYNNLTDNTVTLLQGLTNKNPKAKVRGVVERYEVKYNGDIADMSPTLKKLVSKLDKETYERTKGTTYEIKNGRVNGEYRVDGKSLLPDTLELKVYLGVEVSSGVGDKGVFSSQLKSIISDVIEHNINTESGDKVDAHFSYKSVLNRITLSPLLTGVVNRILRLTGKQVTDIYFK